MDPSIDEICRRIVEVAPGLHGAGTLSARTLRAIAQAASGRAIRNSVETGSGASTLLFSHLSEHHTVFALNGGSGSISNIRRSPLLRQSAVTFVEGPTQATLPRHHFAHKLQLALIDGPHAYPFPDLEYYFLYPHLEAGALLIVDDIHIPSVHNLFEFLRRDAMFKLDRVVQTTAFFTRTDAPVFDPLGDGWQRQEFNANTLLRYGWKNRALPVRARQIARRLLRHRAHCPLQILTPQTGASVQESGTVTGTAVLPDDSHLWILVRRRDVDGWWPQGGAALSLQEGHWSVSVNYGEPRDAGCDFEILAMAVGTATHELWTDWVARVKESGLFPPVQLPPAEFVLGEAYRTVRRSL